MTVFEIRLSQVVEMLFGGGEVNKVFSKNAFASSRVEKLWRGPIIKCLSGTTTRLVT